MTVLARFPGTALCALLLLASPATAARAQAPAGEGLGLCPASAGRLDGYVKALCEGELALREGDFSAALERFRFAAALPRVDATNELAWAGLAAAHCRSSQIDAGRQWAAHFAQARQLWLGELDCDAVGEDPRARLSPFVRSRMCGGQLAADYAIVRANPQAAYSLDLQARLQRVGDAVGAACAAGSAAQAQPGAGGQASGAGGRKVAAAKSTRPAKGGGNRRRAGKKSTAG